LLGPTWRWPCALAVLLVAAGPPAYASSAIGQSAATKTSGASLEAAPDAASSGPQRRSPRQQRSRGRTLEGRVAIYTKQLNLDPLQQSQLRELLLRQRAQVLQLWNDSTLSAAQRVHATGAISDATADGVRALLNEEQRRKFNLPRPPRDRTAQTGAPSVEDWINGSTVR
jgi:hypothetical protein